MDIFEQLRRDEDEKLFAYQDSKGFWTIGVGICIDSRVRGAGITKEESAYLFQHRVERMTQMLSSNLPYFNALDPTRQAVLTNMAFNLGFDGLEGVPKMLQAVAQGDWNAAADEMRDSLWAKHEGDTTVGL